MSRWLRAVMLPCIFILLFSLTGCGISDRQNQTSYSVTDADGTVVSILHKPQRILTIGASSDEMMLGLVEPKRMVAINETLANTEDTNIPWVREKISNVISHYLNSPAITPPWSPPPLTTKFNPASNPPTLTNSTSFPAPRLNNHQIYHLNTPDTGDIF